MSVFRPPAHAHPAAPVDLAAPPAAGRWRESGASLKWRLTATITASVVVMLLAGGGYVVTQARQNVTAEVRSTMELTAYFVDARMASLSERRRSGDKSAPVFELRALRDVRHLQVMFVSPDGRVLESNQAEAQRSPTAPAWFVWLVQRWSAAATKIVRPVNFDGVALGQVLIRPDPTYEIDETWTTSRGLLELLLVFSFAVNALVWWSVARALHPVETILGALAKIGRGQLQTRLPLFNLPEMSRISAGFNHMAQTLERSVLENQSLTRNLIQMQETERRSLAAELHDEIGQCLAGIHADAAAIRNCGGPAVRESADAIVGATGRIKEIVRSMLQRLRPGALEGLGLGLALRDLVGNFRQRNPGISCELRVAEELSGLQGELGIAVYRVVQECLTNISRHAGARHVEVALHTAADAMPNARSQQADKFELTVSDDGQGFCVEQTKTGFGLLGIRERVKAIGGHCRVDSAHGSGTRITAELPLLTTGLEPA